MELTFYKTIYQYYAKENPLRKKAP